MQLNCEKWIISLPSSRWFDVENRRSFFYELSRKIIPHANSVLVHSFWFKSDSVIIYSCVCNETMKCMLRWYHSGSRCVSFRFCIFRLILLKCFSRNFRSETWQVMKLLPWRDWLPNFNKKTSIMHFFSKFSCPARETICCITNLSNSFATW